VRADGEPGLDPVPELDVEEVPGAEVPRRGHSRGQQLARVFRHPQEQVRVVSLLRRELARSNFMGRSPSGSYRLCPNSLIAASSSH
jgi:hypothetical protein